MVLTADQIYTFLGVTAGAGGILSLAFQGLKKSSNFLTAKETKWAIFSIHLLTIVFSVVGAAAYYFIEFYHKLPIEILGVSTATIYGFMQALYNVSKSLAGTSVDNAESRVAGLLTNQQKSTQSLQPVASSQTEPDLLAE